ncbi:MAG: sulfatase [Planctomycetota bacterium]|nr:MAG: sulfatase [Planctomycetota bacterium]
MTHPNLLFVFPDQMRGQAIGALGEESVITPNLDRFATEGLLLDNVSATYPICSPFRAMLMTGKYPFSNKVISNCTSRTAQYDVELQEDDRCWSDILKDRGYSLGYIGKWHLDSPREPYIDCQNNRGDPKWNEWCPPNRRHGFDYWYSYGTYDRHTNPMYWSNDATRDEFHFVDQWGPEHEADMAIKYIQNKSGAYREQDQPFSLVVSMNPPHMPYNLVPDRYVEQYTNISDDELFVRANIPPVGTEWGDYYRANIRNYFSMITGVDDQFGRIISALDNAGLADNTIVVFTSDHGNCLGIHNEIAKNNHYEESIRIPFIIRWPGELPIRRDNLLLSAPDIFPTLMDLMGFSEDVPEEVEGISYADVFRGQDMERPESQLYVAIDPEQPKKGTRGLRTKTHTLLIDRRASTESVVLHDNKQDPYQLSNIAPSNQELVTALSQELDLWLRKTNDPWVMDHP